MNDEIIQQISLDKIDCVEQIRKSFDEEAIDGLAKSLAESGLQQPIRLRANGEKFIVIMGARRVMAARKCGLSTIGAIIQKSELSETEIVQLQFVENCQRESITPLAKASAIQRLMKLSGWSATRAASKLGLSNSAVTRLLSLLSLPDAIRAKIETGEITASAGYELARVGDSEQLAKLAAQVANGELSRDALSGAVKAKKTSATEEHADTPAARETAKLNGSTRSVARAVAKLGGGRCVIVTAPSLTLDSMISALEEILTRARQTRTRGLTLPTFCKILRDQAQAK